MFLRTCSVRILLKVTSILTTALDIRKAAFRQRRWFGGLFVLDCRISLAGMVYMAGLVFAVGGFNGSLRVRTVDSYDPVKDQWTSVANMRDRRSTLGAAVLNGLLYAVGGFDGSTGEFLFISPALPLAVTQRTNRGTVRCASVSTGIVKPDVKTPSRIPLRVGKHINFLRHQFHLSYQVEKAVKRQ